MIKELYDQSVLWQMNAAERMAMFYLFDRMPTKNKAIEVGSYKGGFTRVLANQFKRVVSIDIDHSNIVDKYKYENVEWLTGLSTDKIPIALSIHHNVDFILIDGDHSCKGVYEDIEACIKFTRMTSPLILVHDAAYSESRKALIEIGKRYGDSYYVDINFVPGVPFNDGLIGGLAIIYKR